MRKAIIGLVALVIFGMLGFLALTSPSAYRFIRGNPSVDFMTPASLNRTPDPENDRVLFFALLGTPFHAAPDFLCEISKE